MSWLRIDDHFADHPKLLRAGPIAGWLHLAGLCYSARHLTDGFLPIEAVGTLATFNGVSITGNGQLFSEPVRVITMDLVETLVRVGLWEVWRDGDMFLGYRIHDYLKYNPSRAEVEGERESKKNGGLARAATGARQAGRFAPRQQPAGGLLAEVRHPRTPTPTRTPSSSKEEEKEVRRKGRVGLRRIGEVMA